MNQNDQPKKITPDQLQAKLDNNEPVQLIDVRDTSMHSAGHIPGSVNLPIKQIESEAANALPDKNAPIVCYCGGGTKAGRSAEALKQLGYTDISILPTGLRGWCGENRPTETD